MTELNELMAQALEEIRRLRAANQRLERARQESIAIVGAACRYPGGIASLDDLWLALKEGRDGIDRMTQQRWPMERFHSNDPARPGAIYTDAMGLLSEVDRFDAAHFGLKAEEARHIDPQHRLLMELTSQVIEDAGYPVESFSGTRTGVYVGVMTDDYAQLQGPLEQASFYVGAGMAKSCAAGRLAFTFGLEGPALVIDTACSSSLVSVHLAAQALRRGECEAAVAGGVNLILSPQGSVIACRTQMLSKTGRCHTFDARADGYVRSEGGGLVLLKRLSDAQRDGDRIYALIRGTAVNHDGRSQGLTAPNGQAQRRVIGAALADAGVEPRRVDFVECHGTGTALGDPVEVRALQASYVTPGEDRLPLVLGAIKSNLGHMEAAAGIAGLHKAMQVVRHREVPRNLHFESLNPQISVDSDKVRIAAQSVELATQGPVLAGVSSFGFSGTNAHVILEQYTDPSPANAGGDEEGGVFKLAAGSSRALIDYATRYLAFMADRPALDARSLCFTAAVGRSDGRYRLAFTARDVGDVRSCLGEFLEVVGGDEALLPADSWRSLWLFDAEEHTDWSLARQLHDTYALYRDVVREAYEHLGGRSPQGLPDYLALLNGTVREQQTPPLVAHAVHRLAMAKLLLHCGLVPTRVVGFGYGEFIAAAIAGVIAWQDLLDVVFAGRVNSRLSPRQARYDFVSTFPAAAAGVAWLGCPVAPGSLDPGALTAVTAAFANEKNTGGDHVRVELGAQLRLVASGVCERRGFHWVHGQTNRDPSRSFDGFVARCYMAGATIDWSSLYADRKAPKASLPTYPFQRERYWTDWGFVFDSSIRSTVGRQDIPATGRPGGLGVPGIAKRVDHKVLTSVLPCPSGVMLFFGELSLESMPALRSHRVFGESVVPASLYFDLMLVAAEWCWPGRPVLLDAVQLLRKRVVGGEPIEVCCQLRPGDHTIEIHTRSGAGSDWEQNVRASVEPLVLEELPPHDLAAYQALCPAAVPLRAHYDSVARSGIEYGAEFQGIVSVSAGSGCALARIALPKGGTPGSFGHYAHPVLLDSCLQAIGAADTAAGGGDLYVPALIRGLRCYRSLPESLWCFVQVTELESAGQSGSGANTEELARKARCATLTVLDPEGRVVLTIDRFETTLYRAGARGTAAGDDYRDWIFAKGWLEQEAARAVSGTGSQGHAAHWVLFSNQDASSDDLETRLRARGDRVSVVCLGAATKSGRIQVRPDTRDAFIALLAAIERDTGPITGAIYAWSLQPADMQEPHLRTALERLAQYPLYLCQAVLDTQWRDVALTFLTRGAQPVADGNVTQPLAALLWGHVACFVNENHLHSRLIDMDPLRPEDDGKDNEWVLHALQEPSETQIAIRGGRRYVARLMRAALDTETPRRIVANGCYLITGGFGALGAQTARELSRQGAKHLILVGRDIQRAASQTLLGQLEDAGTRVYPLQADVADEPSFGEGLRRLLADLPPLRGVVHSVGVLADGSVANQTWARYLQVFAGKVFGTLHLQRAVGHLPLDFFILYSSAAAILGNPGQANYAAANTFMDSFAWYLRAHSRRALSINWAGWSEIGLASALGPRHATRPDTLVGTIPTKHGTEVIARQFACASAQVAVIPLRLQSQAQVERMPHLRALLTDLMKSPAAAQTVRQQATPPAAAMLQTLRTIPASERAARLQRYVDDLVAGLLGTGPVDSQMSLFDAGLDSLLSIDLRARLERDLECKLPSTLLHDRPSTGGLTAYLLESVVALMAPPEGALPPRASQPAIEPRVETSSASSPVAVSQRRPHAARARDAGEIAIIGVSARYPGAPSVDVLWNNLLVGKDSITEIPPDRWDHVPDFSPRKDVPGKTYCKWGGFIDGVDQFDASFFAIAPQAARLMDPQARLFLETAWNLLEETGHTRRRLHQAYDAQVGVFVGAMYQLYPSCATDESERTATLMTSYHEIANAVSHFFGLRGPSIAVDTMCSSALTAIDLACRDLLRGNCGLAIAGGVNLSIHPRKFIALSQAQIVGSHPGSRSFADGDGFLPAEGVGAVLLKPLSQAIRDDDTILAVIKSSRTNHGGHSTGFHAPNPIAQIELVEENFRRCGVDPESISYVEAAANGASLGDAVEVRALTEAFGRFTGRKQFCPIGTVKSNIGHPEAASGVAQLAKVILQLRHRRLVPSIGTARLNPNIDFAGTPFYLVTEPRPWERPRDLNGLEASETAAEFPRRATISSFGAGGSNAHLIVEEYCPGSTRIELPHCLPCADDGAPDAREVIVLSARTPAALRASAQRLLDYVRNGQHRVSAYHPATIDGGGEPLLLADIACTLQLCKEEMEYRMAFCAADLDELVRTLERYRDTRGAATGLQRRMRRAPAAGAPADPEELASHWERGGTVDWVALRTGRPGRRVYLPTYPFARSAVWLASGLSGKAAAADPGTTARDAASLVADPS